MLLRPDSPDDLLGGPPGAPNGDGPEEATALWLRAVRVSLLLAQRHPKVSLALANAINTWRRVSFLLLLLLPLGLMLLLVGDVF